MPRVVSAQGRYELLVDGKPYLILGAQVNNSSNYPAMLPDVWPAFATLHAKRITCQPTSLRGSAQSISPAHSASASSYRQAAPRSGYGFPMKQAWSLLRLLQRAPVSRLNRSTQTPHPCGP